MQNTDGLYDNEDFEKLIQHPTFRKLDRQDSRYIGLVWFSVSDLCLELKKLNLVMEKMDDAAIKNMDGRVDSDDDYLWFYYYIII